MNMSVHLGFCSTSLHCLIHCQVHQRFWTTNLTD